MFDVIKTAFVLANNGWLGAVLLTLSLAIIIILVVLFKRQKKLLDKTRKILDKTVSFDTLSTEFKDFSKEIDSCFKEVHKVLDSANGKSETALESKHDKIARAHEQLVISGAAIAKDLAEIKGMFNSAMSGLRVGIK